MFILAINEVEVDRGGMDLQVREFQIVDGGRERIREVRWYEG